MICYFFNYDSTNANTDNYTKSLMEIIVMEIAITNISYHMQA